MASEFQSNPKNAGPFEPFLELWSAPRLHNLRAPDPTAQFALHKNEGAAGVVQNCLWNPKPKQAKQATKPHMNCSSVTNQ